MALADQVAEPDRLPADQRRGLGAALLQPEDGWPGRAPGRSSWVGALTRNSLRAAPGPAGLYGAAGWALSYPGAVHYETVAATYRDLEAASGRLALIDRLAELLAPDARTGCCRRCRLPVPGPDRARRSPGWSSGMAERMAARAVADGRRGAGLERGAGRTLRETGDLGLAAEQLLAGARAGAAGGQPGGRRSVFDDPAPGRRGRGGGLPGPQAGRGWSGCWSAATPLEARYLVRTVTGSLRLGDRHRHHPRRPGRGPRRRPQAAVDPGAGLQHLLRPGPGRGHAGRTAAWPRSRRMQVRAGNPVRPMLAQRMSERGRDPGQAGRDLRRRAQVRRHPGPGPPHRRRAPGAVHPAPGAGRGPVPRRGQGAGGRPRAHGRRSWRARWSPSTRPPASCARSRR